MVDVPLLGMDPTLPEGRQRRSRQDQETDPTPKGARGIRRIGNLRFECGLIYAPSRLFVGNRLLSKILIARLFGEYTYTTEQEPLALMPDGAPYARVSILIGRLGFVQTKTCWRGLRTNTATVRPDQTAVCFISLVHTWGVQTHATTRPWPRTASIGPPQRGLSR